MSIVYAEERDLSVADYSAVIGSTYMGARRALGNPDRIARILAGSHVLVTAREDGDIVGVARGISDGEWVCYLADLAIRDGHQREGIGKGLLEATKRLLGPRIGLVLMAYPEAIPFYRRLGLGEMTAFYMDREVGT